MKRGGIEKAVGEADEKSEAFLMRGKITLAKCKDLALTGSAKALAVRKNEVDKFLDHPMAQKIVDMVVKMVLREPVQFDITTVNDLPGAKIEEIMIDAKRIKIGLKLGYKGPLDLTKISAAVQSAVNEGAKAVKEAAKLAKTPYAKCLVKAAQDKVDAEAKAYTKSKIEKGTCYFRYPLVKDAGRRDLTKKDVFGAAV